MPDVNITVDGKKVTAPAGTLLIEACKTSGVEVPAFCYYPGLSLQGACRMCMVKIEKMPKLQTACTTVISEGMNVTTAGEEVEQARKSMVELLLGNHPLDCPVCDAGGECELQDMTFSYGAAESKYMEVKNHKEEQQWSPVVFFDRPRCILCYRCVRVCDEAMDVAALGIQNRGSGSVIAPNMGDHLECEECGMCIDICPVGALTSGAYRYKTRPWEMTHTATACGHCGDGCKTTLGVRRSETGMEIVRGDNRDKSGPNGDFLCVKGRYAFDFANHTDRLTQPLLRKSGKLVPVTWEEALTFAGQKLAAIKNEHGGASIGVIGSNRTTNEENYLLQKFARIALGTNNIDHVRTADFPAFAAALAGKPDATASIRDFMTAPAILVIGGDPTEQHPLLAYQIRNNVRLNQARLYLVNSDSIKMRRQATLFAQVPQDGGESAFVAFLAGGNAPGASQEEWTALRDQLRKESGLAIAFSADLRGNDITNLVKFGSGISGAKFACLGDYANSRGAGDMGLYPDLLPGYTPLAQGGKFREAWGSLPDAPGLTLPAMVDAAKDGKLRALIAVGANPVARMKLDAKTFAGTFVIVQDIFLSETAALADVVFPAASAYEKSGTFTNTYGDLQLGKKAGEITGVKSDFEILVRLAERMGFDVRRLVTFGTGTRADMGQSRGVQSGEADRNAVWLEAQNLEPKLSPFDPAAALDEIQTLVPGYQVSRLNLMAGNDQHTRLDQNGGGAVGDPNLIQPSGNGLFSSGSLGRYSKTLNTVMENKNPQPSEVAAD